MIRNEKEYQEASRRLSEDQRFAAAQRAELAGRGLTQEEIDRVMEPTLSFHAQLKEEVEWYEQARRGDFRVLRNLEGIGQALIALRIANGNSQKELADRLGVSEAQVSRDERNEYRGITVDRVQRILEALEGEMDTHVVAKNARMARPIELAAAV